MLADAEAYEAEARGVIAQPERKPLAGYLRLTVDRHGRKIGYDVQKRAIEAGATALGETIGEWYQDKDLTAADIDVIRPDFERMLSDVQGGLWGGIAVWRLDRLVRLTREFERVNAITEDRGAFILSIDPLMSTKDQMGKFVMRILVMLAEMEIDTMKARARGHQAEKARTGKYKGGGSRPFGFEGAIKDEDGRVLNPGRVGIAHNETEAALIREAAERLLDGESYAEILRDWGTRNPPVTGTQGQGLRTTALRQMMLSPRIAGLREYTESDPVTGQGRTAYAKAEWEGIISVDDWRSITALTKTRGRGRPAAYLLTGGLIVCGRCGQRMIGGVFYYTGASKDNPPVNVYRCETGVHAQQRGSCGKVSIQAKPVDALVLEAVTQRLAQSPELFDALDEAMASHSTPIVSTAMETIAACDRKLEDFATMAALPASKGGISVGEWKAFRTAVMAEREEAVRRLESHRSTRAVPTPMGRDRQELKRWMKGLTITQRRSFVRLHARSVEIAPALRRGIVDLGRVSILFADAKVPHAGSDKASVSDLDADALAAAPLVEVG